MAKIFNIYVCILLLCGCNDNRLPEAGLTKPTTESVADVPVLVDTLQTQDTARSILKPDSNPAPPVAVLSAPAAIPLKPLRQVYSDYIGVREATGKNDGPQVERFLRNVGLGKGFPWCAAFVKTCLLEAGSKDAGRINGMALSCENKGWILFKNRKLVDDPEPGDVFTLWYANLNRIGHTGFFDRRINLTVFESVEGNTNSAGSREGDGVYRKKRSFNATYSISRWP